MTDSDLRYPIGQYQPPPEPLSPADRALLIQQVAAAPGKLRAAVAGLSEVQLDTPYRDGGWTVRQVVHHVPESHLNAYCRLKLAITEDTPTIKTYEEARWAVTPEVAVTPIDVSLTLLESLHRRWVALWERLTPDQFQRQFHHPEWGTRSLDWLLAQYAWHGRHHVAHITSLRDRKGWTMKGAS